MQLPGLQCEDTETLCKWLEAMRPHCLQASTHKTQAAAQSPGKGVASTQQQPAAQSATDTRRASEHSADLYRANIE